jgi:hypothetical protein
MDSLTLQNQATKVGRLTQRAGAQFVSSEEATPIFFKAFGTLYRLLMRPRGADHAAHHAFGAHETTFG